MAYTGPLQPPGFALEDTYYVNNSASVKRIDKLGFSFRHTAAARYGPNENNLFDVNFADIRLENTSDLTGLFSGDVQAIMPGGFSREIPILLTGSDPLPATVLAVWPNLDATGK